MPATKPDALEVLRQQVPPKVFAFAEALAADQEMRPSHAALVTGQNAQTMMRDPRTHRVLATIMADDRAAMQDTRRAGIAILAAICGADPRDALDAKGFPMAMSQWPTALVALANIHLGSDGSMSYSFKAADRLKAISMLLAHFGDLGDTEIHVDGKATVVFRGRGE